MSRPLAATSVHKRQPAQRTAQPQYDAMTKEDSDELSPVTMEDGRPMPPHVHEQLLQICLQRTCDVAHNRCRLALSSS